MLEINTISHASDILKCLMESEHYVNSPEIQDKLAISRRSFFYALNKTNIFLEQNNLDPVMNVKGIGYYLSDNTKKALPALLSEQTTAKKYSSECRIEMTIWYLINDQVISITSLMNLFNISNHTAIKDMDRVSLALEEHNLHLKQVKTGKLLEGSEINQRKWVLEQLTNTSSSIHQTTYFQQDRLAIIDTHIRELEDWSQNYFTDNAHVVLSKFIYWLLDRTQHSEHQLTQIDNQFGVPDPVITQWVDKIFQEVHVFNHFEIVYLSQIMNTSQFSSINATSQKTLAMQNIATDVIEQFNIVSGSNINSHSLVVALSTHLLSVLYRVRLGIKYTHPNLKDFLEKYYDLFIFSKFAIRPFESNIGQPLSDDEISLIAIYFGGYLKENERKSQWNTDVLLVCSSGIGTSVLLKNQLTTKYPDITFSEPLSIFQFENCPLDDVRLVISTIALNKDYGVPTLQVSPLLTSLDIKHIDDILRTHHSNVMVSKRPSVETLLDIISEFARIENFDKLSKALNSYLDSCERIKSDPSQSINQGNDLKSLLSAKNIMINHDCPPIDWQTAIRKSFFPLVQDHSVSERYVEKIIQLTQTKGPYMLLGNGVFLAHATPQDGVKKLGLSLFITDSPISLKIGENDEKHIKIIVGLAPVDQKQHLKVLSELLQKIQDKDWLCALHQSQTVNQILGQLHQ